MRTHEARPWRTLISALVVVGLMGPATLHAAVTPGSATAIQREQAQTRFNKGKLLYNSKKFAAALIELQASMDIVASPNTRILVARCLRETGKLVDAFVEFGRTEVEGRELAREDPRYGKTAESAAVERKALESKLAFLTLSITGATETTTLKVAGEPVRRAGWTEPVPAAPGTVELLLETPGRPEIRQTLTLKPGERRELALDAGKDEAVVVVKKAEEPVVTPVTRSSNHTAAYVAFGVGAAGFLGFGIFGALSKSSYDTLRSECGGPCPESRRSEVESAQTKQTVANVALVVGVLGAVTGVTLFLLSPKKTEPTAAVRAEVFAFSGGLGVRGSF